MYTTETDVKTQVRTGEQTPSARQYTLFEPEFKPFSYGTNQQILAREDDVPTNLSTHQPIEEIVASEPEFEVEKQYTFDTTSYEQNRTMSIPTLERNQEIVASNEVETRKHVRIRLNARGKIIATVYSIIVAIILAFTIYNAVVINSLNSDIASKNQLVATQTEVITELQNTYNSLGESDTIISQLGDSYKNPTEADTVSLDGFKMQEREEKAKETNWFESFCEAMRKLFS